MRRPHPWRLALPSQLIWLSLLGLLSWGIALSATPGPSAGETTAAVGDTVTRYYTMTAHVRPLLLWMTCADIGGARIRWNRVPGPDSRVDLLIGSDPDHAPLGINRWGFISEQVLGDTAQLTGLMSDIDDGSLDRARKDGVELLAGGQVFRSVRTIVRNQDATSNTSRLVVDKNLTFRYYNALLDRASAATSGSEQRLHLRPGTDPGPLVALKALVHETVERWQREQRVEAAEQRDFVYVGKIYRVSLRHAALVKDSLVGGRHYGSAIDGEFEIRNQVTGEITDFEMLFGTAAAEAETPLRVVYRPRWWVELELLLTDPAAPKNAFAMGN